MPFSSSLLIHTCCEQGNGANAVRVFPYIGTQFMTFEALKSYLLSGMSVLPSAAACKASPVCMQRVLMNLATNARRSAREIDADEPGEGPGRRNEWCCLGSRHLPSGLCKVCVRVCRLGSRHLPSGLCKVRVRLPLDLTATSIARKDFWSPLELVLSCP